MSDFGATPNSQTDATDDALRWMIAQARPRKRRTLAQFAEQEYRLPDGPFSGAAFRCDRLPYARLLFDEIERRHWRRVVIVGPSQSGKSTAGFVLPALYHLFELGETVILGVPDMDMVADKWSGVLLPAIRSTQYAKYLPKRGGGSRGGKVAAVQFTNGATLRFMTGGGGDKSRAGYTSRVLIITETDGMDESGGSSRESDKIAQLEARTAAWGDRAVVYMECTVTIDTGRTWREYTEGTASRIVCPCPSCSAYVLPERDNLTGWQGAESIRAARETAAFACPDCGYVMREEERRAAVHSAVLLHRGQSVGADGVVTGDVPATDTLGFRWNAMHNLLLTAGDIGAEEWRAARADDEENARRKMMQFVWAVPYVPKSSESTSIEFPVVATRTRAGIRRGHVPADMERLTVGVDLGQRLGHYAAIAWGGDGSGHVVEHDVFEVHSDELTTERAIIVALQELRDRIGNGWVTASGQPVPIGAAWIDAGWSEQAVYAFLGKAGRETAWKWRPTKGIGAMQLRPTRRQSAPVEESAQRTEFGMIPLMVLSADHWKSFVHARLRGDPGGPGSLLLFDAPASEHIAYAKHIAAEQEIREFAPGRGEVVRWVNDKRRPNHWLDATAIACAAGHWIGVRVIAPDKRPAASPTQPRRPIATANSLVRRTPFRRQYG